MELLCKHEVHKSRTNTQRILHRTFAGGNEHSSVRLCGLTRDFSMPFVADKSIKFIEMVFEQETVYFLPRNMKLRLSIRKVDSSGVDKAKEDFGSKKHKKKIRQVRDSNSRV